MNYTCRPILGFIYFGLYFFTSNFAPLPQFCARGGRPLTPPDATDSVCSEDTTIFRKPLEATASDS